MNKQKMAVNGERLKETLEKFSSFGHTENNGVTRLALSEEDKLSRDYFRSCCEELGMVMKCDDMGNMYATLDGKEDKPPIVMGSHLDSVKKGGRFDGVLGVIAGLEVVCTLVENQIKPEIPIVVANFTNEEGARFEPAMMSSGVISGHFDKEEMTMKADTEGITFAEALAATGYEGDQKNRLKSAKAFLELHIEQGPVLEKEKLDIGVVECVVGMVCYDIEVIGESDHAGTTPMHMRNDAFFATADLVIKLREQLDQLDESLVYTMGRIHAEPNIPTVIPNKVRFSVEARHQDPQVIKQVEDIINNLTQAAEKENYNIKTAKLWERDTVWFDKEIVSLLEESVKEFGYPFKTMTSGAGHDAQYIATYIPTAMIFVPSINGKSHDEDELTTWEDCEKGTNVLLETVLKMAVSQR
jgi:N-carbamoyl-L-amino-acid hydrolase